MKPVGSKKIFLAVLSAILLNLCFPNYNLWLLAWFAFVPLFFAIEKTSKLKAFFFAYLAGVIFWSGNIYWLIHVTLPGTIILILYLALYFGLFGLIITPVFSLLATRYLILIPSLWVLLEYLRSYLFTGFPWSLLAYAQSFNLPIIQIAEITGVWGVSFLVMMVNVAVYSLLRPTKNNSHAGLAYTKPALAFLCIVVSLVYGYYRIYSLKLKAYSLGFRTTVIQGNIPQELKWASASSEYIMQQYLKISRQAAQEKPDLIIWPEAALPVVLEEEPEFFQRIEDFAREVNLPLLLGAVTKRGELYYNSALLLSHEGKTLLRYDKLHLVPFGEYIPLRNIFKFLSTIAPIGDIERGKEYTIFQIPNPKIQNNFAVLICFEDLFPELSRQFVKRGAGFLVNITNDAWYKYSSAPYQHLQASVFRAVENRRYLARAANTGVSSFISPSGRIVSLLRDKTGKNIFIAGFATENIFLGKQNLTFYTVYGDIFIFILVFLIIYGIFRPVPSR